PSRLDRLGQAAYALVDLVHGDRREGQAQRMLAAFEQEVGACDDGYAEVGGLRDELAHVHIGRQVDPEEVAAVGLGVPYALDPGPQRSREHRGALGERLADLGDGPVDVARRAELVDDALRHLAGRDVEVGGPLGDGLDEVRLPDQIPHAYAGADRLRERAGV